MILAPGQATEALRDEAVSLARALGRNWWGLDARQLQPASQAPGWLQRLGQGQVLLWLENAHHAALAALTLLQTHPPGSLHVLVASPRPLGVPGEQVCVASTVAGVATTSAPECSSLGLRWRARATPLTHRA